MNDMNPERATAGMLDALNDAAIAAGKAILKVREAGLTVEKKYDSSPVTEADRAAEALIMERLADIAPDIPVVAEEAVYAGNIPELDTTFFLVDPLDGTREFTRGGSDFTVNIGLIRDRLPTLGVIFVPVTGDLYWGEAGVGAFHAVLGEGDELSPPVPIAVRPVPEGPIDVVASRSHRTPETDEFIDRFRVGDLVSAGSSLKFCVVACGKADLYPRMGTTMQWDTAAGDAILRAAGGRVMTLEGAPLGYGAAKGVDGPDRFRNPWFVASGPLDPFAT